MKFIIKPPVNPYEWHVKYAWLPRRVPTDMEEAGFREYRWLEWILRKRVTTHDSRSYTYIYRKC